jgi:hypothetical protein
MSLEMGTISSSVARFYLAAAVKKHEERTSQQPPRVQALGALGARDAFGRLEAKFTSRGAS